VCDLVAPSAIGGPLRLYKEVAARGDVEGVHLQASPAVGSRCNVPACRMNSHSQSMHGMAAEVERLRSAGLQFRNDPSGNPIEFFQPAAP
jgi:hypothetical protein